MPEKWEQVKEILASALGRSSGERADFVREACGEDSSLRAEVESLLASHDDADSLLEESPVANVFSSSAVSMIGRKIGAYRILQETGQGGMAVVYLAERADQEFRKHVAIKMVKPGGNSE
jgi:serine/threonine protein kinase